jgi:hypothetical protein
MSHNRTRKLAALAIAALATSGLTVLQTAQPAAAYNVCSDANACVHEKMSAFALDLIPPGSEAAQFAQDIWNGAGHEDGVGDPSDHIYGYPFLPLLNEAVITMPHFWDSDAGDETKSTYGDFEEPLPIETLKDMWEALDVLDLIDIDIFDTTFIETENAWQKARQFWVLAQGAYANGDKHKAYEYLGHIVHLMGDQTVPTHAHGDAHVKVVYDADPYENWMSDLVDGDHGHMNLTDPEKQRLRDEDATVDPLHAAVTGRLDEKVPAGVDPLYYLLYTTNQLADFFTSRDVDGDTVDRHGWVKAELDDMSTKITSPRVQDDLDNNDNDGPGEDINNADGDLNRVRNTTYFYGIRAIAALYRVFDRTVRQPTLAVRIDSVDDDDDDVDTFDDADMYARVSVNGKRAQNRGEEKVNTEHVNNPGWAFGNNVPLTGSVPLTVDILDEDGESPLVPSLNFGDDLMDISPDDDEAIGGLNLSVDMAKCIKKEPGAITGSGITATCGTTIDVTGDNDPFNPLESADRAHLRFTVFLSNLPPVADAGGNRSTPEGTNITLDGTGSSDPEGGALTYAWDLDGDGACDDSSGDSTPEFTAVGQDGDTTVKVCVTDPEGLTDDDTAVVTVTNVAPAVSASDPTTVSENTATTVSGTVSDPGWLDPLSATIDWGDGSGAQTLTGTLENVRPDATFTFSTTHTYGDNGTWTVRICGSDDDTSTCKDISATVSNTDPTAVIDTTNTVSVNGIPTVIAHAGTNVDFKVRITDPGSDDLTTRWDWGDGAAVSTTTDYVNPPDADPAKSPSIQPRDISPNAGHSFNQACTYTSALGITDDDGGTATGSLNVVIVGNNHPNRPHGYWKQQYRYYAFNSGPAPDIDATTADCYLKIVGYMSRVFNEQTAASTAAQSYDVLDTSATSVMNELFDQQLLAAWLNFANGAIDWNRLVDTNNDKRVDTQFLTAMVNAETVRLNPSVKRKQLEDTKKIVESWTNLP